MALESAVLALGLAASPLSQVYDCTLEPAQRQMLQKTVITQPADDSPGRIVGAFSSDFRSAALLEPGNGAVRSLLHCTPIGGDRVVVCTESDDKVALVLFQDGRLRISVRADDPDKWISISGQCALRADPPKPGSGAETSPPSSSNTLPSPDRPNHARPL